jgi:hypothetical protein
METQELQEPDSQDSKTDRASRKNSLGRLKDRLKAIDKLIHDSKTKAGKREDLCIQASEIERLLWQADRDDKADKTLAQLATLTAEVARLSEENARLTRVNAELHARASNAQVERIPDDRVPALQADNAAKGELLAAISPAVSSLPHVERVNFGAVLVKQLGRASGVQAFVSQITDFSILWLYSQKSNDELQEIIAAAFKDSQGSAVIAAKATLGARGVPISPPAKGAPYHDFFA